MTKLSGTIDKIIFQSEDSGFTVATFTSSDENDLEIQTTVTGVLPNVKPGNFIKIKGNWVVHDKFGEQFKIESFSSAKPSTVTELSNYLQSGSIPGVSKKLGKRIIKECGDKFFDILEDNPHELLKIKGLGKKTLDKIIEFFRDQSENLDVIAKLQEFGISSKLAKRIFDTYKDKTVSTVLNNPYDLALNVRGIGFNKADDIANKVGLDKNNEGRIAAGLLYTIQDCYRSGNTFLTQDEFFEKATRLLDIDEEELDIGLSNALFSGKIYESSENQEPIYYPIELYHAESDSALSLVNLSREKVNDKKLDLQHLINKTEKKLGLKFDESQIKALETVTHNPITVITGGPGTGKSATRSVVNKTKLPQETELLI